MGGRVLLRGGSRMRYRGVSSCFTIELRKQAFIRVQLVVCRNPKPCTGPLLGPGWGLVLQTWQRAKFMPNFFVGFG